MKANQRFLQLPLSLMVKLPVITAIILILLSNLVFAEVVEKIYAVVNDEVITYSELKDFEQGMTTQLKTEYEGEELFQKINEMKEKLLDLIIEQKLLYSRAKEKNYDVTQYLEIVIKEIIKNNNLNSQEELKRALTANGIDFEDWKKKRKDELITQSLIQEEIGQKIKIENAELMAYYRENKEKYTKPALISLNCIFLNKENYFTQATLEEKKQEISAKLAEPNAKFDEIAAEYSELPGAETKHFLGDFKKGELDAKLEEAAFNLQQGGVSPWIDTGKGWYIIQLVKFTEAQPIEFKTVRDEIERIIRDMKLQERLGEYVDRLKKDSHIKIYQEYQ